MNPRRAPAQAIPSVLVASADARQRQALADALEHGGLRVIHAHAEREVVDLAQFQSPDAIVVDSTIARPEDALCRKLHTLGLATPLLLIVPGDVTRATEHEALRAGVWAVVGTPLDTEDLLLRLSVFIEPKRELDRVSEERLVDGVSGLYTPSGLTRRSTELAELATRHGLALACAVFRPTTPLPDEFAGDRLAMTFKRVSRTSDALGRSGSIEFAVFAPTTNSLTASRLARRMTDTVEHAGKGVAVRAGYSASVTASTISPPALLARARNALEANQ